MPGTSPTWKWLDRLDIAWNWCQRLGVAIGLALTAVGVAIPTALEGGIREAWPHGLLVAIPLAMLGCTILLVGAADFVRRRRTQQTPAKIPSGTFKGQDIHISALAENSVIRDKEFIACEILGPAILYREATTALVECALDEQMAIMLRADQKTVRGAIRLENCLFRYCEFRDVGFAVPHNQHAKWKTATSDD